MNTLSDIKTTIKWNGDGALTLFFDEEAGEVLTRYILSLVDVFNATFPDKIIEAIPAYQSLTLCFDILTIEPDTIEKSIEQVIAKGFTEITEPVSSRIIDIPVCYQGDHAPDLESLATYCKLSPGEVIKRHTQELYLVNTLGFLPGFLYLSGLDHELYCPRKDVPALKVAAGAVGIGGKQTGIYPVDSPGGWHIIGQTPVSIFRPTAKQAFIAQPLDKVRFVPIDSTMFKQLKSEQV